MIELSENPPEGVGFLAGCPVIEDPENPPGAFKLGSPEARHIEV